jgi:hypothetical protein
MTKEGKGKRKRTYLDVHPHLPCPLQHVGRSGGRGRLCLLVLHQLHAHHHAQPADVADQGVFL